MMVRFAICRRQKWVCVPLEVLDYLVRFAYVTAQVPYQVQVTVWLGAWIAGIAMDYARN